MKKYNNNNFVFKYSKQEQNLQIYLSNMNPISPIIPSSITTKIQASSQVPIVKQQYNNNLQPIKQHNPEDEQQQKNSSYSSFNHEQQKFSFKRNGLSTGFIDGLTVADKFMVKRQSLASLDGDQKQVDYYQQFCKLYLANAVLQTHLKELSIQKSQLISKLSKLQKKQQQQNQFDDSANAQRKKRIRRSAADIARHYKCQNQNCSKSYGSEGSLNQHIKLKHPDLFRALGIDQAILEGMEEFEDDDSQN